MYGKIYVYEFEGDMTGRIPAFEDGDYIGCWKEGGYSFVFFHGSKTDLLRRLDLTFRSELVINHEDWESGVPLSPFRVGRIGIHQPWNEGFADAVNLVIDPNMVFGSGLHSSTKGCLTILDRLLSGWTPRRVLDLGTGTGILSLACLKLGASVAVGVDNNELSVKTAGNNSRINRLDDKMHLIVGHAEEMLYVGSDLMIANLHFGALSPLLDRPDFYGRKYYLLSGMIRGQGRMVEERLKDRLRLTDSYCEEFWSTYLFSDT